MADSRINLLTSAPSTANDDFFVVDGGTNGTRKLNAFSPTIGGDPTITGTLTVNGTSLANALVVNGNGIALNTAGSASVRFQDAGTSKWWFYKLSADPNLYVRDMVNGRMQALFTPGATSGVATTAFYSTVTIDATTISTTTSSGALVVSGGVGVGNEVSVYGRIRAQLGLHADGNVPAGLASAYQVDVQAGTSRDILSFGDSSRAGLIRGDQDGSGRATLKFGRYTASTFAEYLRITGVAATDAVLSVYGTTPSTSTSSGALVVSGGMGIAKQIVAGGVISIDPLDASPEDLVPEVAFCRGVSLATTASVLAFGSGARIGLLRGYQDGGNLVEWRFGSYIGTTFNEQMRLGGTSATSSSLTLYGTTASTSTSSGALVVSGGVGVAGKVTSTALGLANTSQSISAWGDIGPQLSIAGAVVTDTTSSGTVSRAVANSINATAFAASSSTTYTQAVSLFIADAPTANTNVTITHRYALYTAGGRINFQGLPTSSAGLQAGTLWNDGGTLKVA